MALFSTGPNSGDQPLRGWGNHRTQPAGSNHVPRKYDSKAAARASSITYTPGGVHLGSTDP